MNIKDIIIQLNTIELTGILKHALFLVNEKREFDSSGATLAFDTRDKICRVGKVRNLNLEFENNKLILKLGVMTYVFTCYNNKKDKSLQNNQSAPKQLGIFEVDDNRNQVDVNENTIVGYKTDKKRKKFSDIFLKYKSANGLIYKVDLLNEFTNINNIPVDTDKEDFIPGFFQPKKSDEDIAENE